MLKTLIRVIMIALFVVTAGSAQAEDEVYYCADDKSIGFEFKREISNKQLLEGREMTEEEIPAELRDRDKRFGQRGEYVPARFNLVRFKIKLDRAYKRLTVLHGGISEYSCTPPTSPHLSWSCSLWYEMFNYNPKNGRYVWVKGLGYIEREPDPLIVSMGKCDKF